MIPLFSCTPPAPDATPEGEIRYVQESAWGQEVWRRTLSGGTAEKITGVSGQLYPGPVDPLGDTLLIAVEETPAHRESAWLLPRGAGAPVLLGPPAGKIRNPSWSPDGQWLYVEADWRSFADIYRMPRSGGEPARLTAEAGGSFEPAVSPDGSQIAFGSSREGSAAIYVMAAAGGPARRLSDLSDDSSHPRWRTATELAWLSRRNGHGRFRRLKMGDAPQAFRPATEGEELDLVFSPDGGLAALTVQRPPDEQGIEVVQGDTGVLLCRLDERGPEEFPTFSPDGKWLVFGSSRTGDPELWIVHPDGTGLRQWTDHPGADWLPRWESGQTTP